MTIKSEGISNKKLTTGVVASRFGVCTRTILRWEADEAFGFPKAMRMRGDRRYWDEAALRAWERKRARKVS
jgi:hypothetical protein